MFQMLLPMMIAGLCTWIDRQAPGLVNAPALEAELIAVVQKHTAPKATPGR